MKVITEYYVRMLPHGVSFHTSSQNDLGYKKLSLKNLNRKVKIPVQGNNNKAFFKIKIQAIPVTLG